MEKQKTKKQPRCAEREEGEWGDQTNQIEEFKQTDAEADKITEENSPDYNQGDGNQNHKEIPLYANSNGKK